MVLGLSISVAIFLLGVSLGLLLLLMWCWNKRKTKVSSNQQMNQPSSGPVYETISPLTNTIELETNEAYGHGFNIQLNSNEAYGCVK